jgi:ABC-2 type transport system ATP-binding protein
MKRKLHFIAALLNSPRILVLDEPHNGMDALTIIRMKELLKDYAKDGRLVFFSSHIIEMIEKICDEVVVIHKGRIADRFNKNDKKFANVEKHYLSLTE